MKTQQPVLPYCKAIFSTEESWLNHQSGAHSEQITCETCNKTYASVYELNRHVKEIHTKAKSFQCSLCDATFSRKYNCKDHIKKKHEISNYDITNHINEIESFTLISSKLIEGENKNQENIEISELINEDDIVLSQENVVTVITEEPISDNNVTEMTLIANQVSIDTGGFQLQFVSISRVINHMTCYIIRVLSLVEITAFRLESKSCKGFFLDKFSINEST